jgi:hypothetical protein
MSIFAGFLFTYPLLLQLSFEYSAIDTGLALMPFSLSLLIAAMVAARLTARFTAKRLIQVGFLITIVGLLVLALSVQPNFSASDLAHAVLLGVGMGMILPVTLNLVLSLVSAKDTPETAGLNATFEQLGNAVGVALVGTIMLVSLSATLEQDINASTVIPDDEKAVLIEAVDDGVELVSDSQLDEGLEAAGAGETTETEVLNIYSDARTEAFQAGVAFLFFVAIVGLILTAGLPNKMLVGEPEENVTEAPQIG